MSVLDAACLIAVPLFLMDVASPSHARTPYVLRSAMPGVPADGGELTAAEAAAQLQLAEDVYGPFSGQVCPTSTQLPARCTPCSLRCGLNHVMCLGCTTDCRLLHCAALTANCG